MSSTSSTASGQPRKEAFLSGLSVLTCLITCGCVWAFTCVSLDVLFWAYVGDAGFCCWACVGVRRTCRSRKPSTMHSATPLSEKGFLLSFFMCLVCLTFLPSVLLNSGGDQKMWITSFAEAKNQKTVNETRSWTAVSWVQDRLISRACHSRTCRVIVST